MAKLMNHEDTFIFAVGTTTDAISHKIIDVTQASVTRINTIAADGIEIANRSGQAIFLDIDAARQLAFMLADHLL